MLPQPRRHTGLQSFSVQPRRGFLQHRALQYRFPALAHTRRLAFAFRQSGIRFGSLASFVWFISCHKDIQVFCQCVHSGFRGSRNKTHALNQGKCILVVLKARTLAIGGSAALGPPGNWRICSCLSPGFWRSPPVLGIPPCQHDTEVGVSPRLPWSSPVCVYVSVFSPCEDTRHWIQGPP